LSLDPRIREDDQCPKLFRRFLLDWGSEICSYCFSTRCDRHVILDNENAVSIIDMKQCEIRASVDHRFR